MKNKLLYFSSGPKEFPMPSAVRQEIGGHEHPDMPSEKIFVTK